MIEIGLGGLFLVLVAIFGCCYCCARNQNSNRGARSNDLHTAPAPSMGLHQRWSDYRTFRGHVPDSAHPRPSQLHRGEPDRVDSRESQPPIYTITIDDQQLPKYEDLFPAEPPKVGDPPTYNNALPPRQQQQQQQSPPPPES